MVPAGGIRDPLGTWSSSCGNSLLPANSFCTGGENWKKKKNVRAHTQTHTLTQWIYELPHKINNKIAFQLAKTNIISLIQKL